MFRGREFARIRIIPHTISPTPLSRLCRRRGIALRGNDVGADVEETVCGLAFGGRVGFTSGRAFSRNLRP
jgi:hypothetical protein